VRVMSVADRLGLELVSQTPVPLQRW
jgi:hypothetical protein